MASRPQGYGLTAELDQKKAGKYDVDTDRKIRKWIIAVLNTGSAEAKDFAKSISPDASSMDKFAEDFKSGVALCHLINVIKPGSVKKMNNSKMAFKMMENIGNFLSAIEQYGVNKTDSFQTVDLYEGQNVPQVLLCLMALDRRIGADSSYRGPRL